MSRLHTPGPWSIREAKSGYGTNRVHIRVVKEQPNIFVPLYVADLYREKSLDETRANAALIAAAPELLEALTLAVECLHKAFDYVPAGQENAACRGNLVPTLQNARAAIAKATATGGAP